MTKKGSFFLLIYFNNRLTFSLAPPWEYYQTKPSSFQTNYTYNLYIKNIRINKVLYDTDFSPPYWQKRVVSTLICQKQWMDVFSVCTTVDFKPIPVGFRLILDVETGRFYSLGYWTDLGAKNTLAKFDLVLFNFFFVSEYCNNLTFQFYTLFRKLADLSKIT